MYRNFISSVDLRVVAFCCVNFEAGEVLGILIVADLGVMLFRPHFVIKADISIAIT
jgi:hypothetical protein